MPRDWFLVNSLAVMALGTPWVGAGLASPAARVLSVNAQEAEAIACTSSFKMLTGGKLSSAQQLKQGSGLGRAAQPHEEGTTQSLGWDPPALGRQEEFLLAERKTLFSASSHSQD